MKKFISFSGGVESRAMALIWGNKADALFADTGSEHQALYNQLDKVEMEIRKFHQNDFKIIRVQNIQYESLEDAILKKSFFPSFTRRYCTKEFKIDPIDNYLKKFKEEGVELMIGLNSDEKNLRTGNHGLLPFVKYSYPLADNGLTRQACIKILDKAGLNPNFPAYMQRGGCKFCYYKSIKEFRAMAILNPFEFDEIIALEKKLNKNSKRKKYYHLISGIENLELFKRTSNSILFNPNEIYPAINDATRCGVFCNR